MGPHNETDRYVNEVLIMLLVIRFSYMITSMDYILCLDSHVLGMFAYSGLTKDEVMMMRDKHHIYCTADGRISMAVSTVLTTIFCCLLELLYNLCFCAHISTLYLQFRALHRGMWITLRMQFMTYRDRMRSLCSRP